MIKSINNVFDLQKESDLRFLSPSIFNDRDMTKEEFEHIFKVTDAFWLHSGNPKDPHAELTAGKCSNGFIDVLRVLRYTNICEIMAEMLVRKLLEHIPNANPDWVVGSDHAAADLSHSVAVMLNAQHDFPEKGPGKTQAWKRFKVKSNEIVLQVEELMTTAKTVLDVRNGIRAYHNYSINFVPVILVLAHRSDIYKVENSEVVYFMHYDINSWEPKDCPLCKAGSKRVHPKANWEELTSRNA